MHYDADTLDDYLHGALGPERDAAIHAHLETCAECRAIYDECASGARLDPRRRAQAEEREFPSMIKARVWEAVRNDRARVVARPPARRVASDDRGSDRGGPRGCSRISALPDRARRRSPAGVAATYSARRTRRTRLGKPAGRPRPDRPGIDGRRPRAPASIGRRRYGGRIRTVMMRAFAAAFAIRGVRSSRLPRHGRADSGAGDPNALVREALDAPRHVSYVGQLQTIRWGNARCERDDPARRTPRAGKHAPHVPRARSAVRRIRHHARHDDDEDRSETAPRDGLGKSRPPTTSSR